MTIQIVFNNILRAADSIKVHRTPVHTNTTLNELASKPDAQVELFFKCEMFQKTGSFKYRGASNAISLLSDEEAECGVVTHSSGNHAQALALAAKNRGVKAYVVMPNTTPIIKKSAAKGYGATVIECEPNQADREKTAYDVMQETGATFISSHNNPNVIAGQGTIALELLSQVEGLDAIIVPVGGGGMLTGCSIAAKALNPNIKVYAAEPEAVNDCYRSFKSKELVTNDVARSVAEGLLTNLGEIAYSEIHNNVDDVFTVSEKEIIDAMEIIWGRMKLCTEASSAVGLAVILYNKEFQEAIKRDGVKRIGVVLSGGNVDIVSATHLFQKFK